MSKTLQRLSKFLFLLLFVALIFIGKVQIWIGVFLISIVLSLFFGRFYCGWICPINTVMNFITKIKTKLHIKSLSVPDFIKKPIFRYGFLIAFLLTFAFVMRSGKKLPVLPALLILGALLTFLFSESLWHRYLCPYGTVLHFTGKKSKRFYKISDSLCISCGKCQKVCPSEAIREIEGKFTIDKSECLACGSCAESCPKEIISY